MNYEKIYAEFLIGTVATMLVFALTVPLQGLRNNMLDSQTTEALSQVNTEVMSYMSKHNGDIPTSVDKLSFSSNSKPAEDVLERITIEKTGYYGYKLCATFYTDTKKDSSAGADSQVNLKNLAKNLSGSYSYGYSNYNEHDAGKYCFTGSGNYDNYWDDDYDFDYGIDLDKYNSSSDDSALDALIGVESKARDTKRQTDIKALHSRLEAYFAQNGRGYPVLADINSATWRAANMKGLDANALCDPSATKQTGCTLVSFPATGAYSYQTWAEDGTSVCAGVAAGNLCDKYTLTATLEDTIDGSHTYSKNSLN